VTRPLVPHELRLARRQTSRVTCSPAPLVVPWHAGSVRIRHDDPALRPYSPRASVLLAAMTLVASVDGLQKVLEATLGEHYRVRVKDGLEVTVGLWRRQA
jgi:hypothetical protein